MGSLSIHRGSSQPRDQTQVSCVMGRFFTSQPQGKPKNTGVGSLSFSSRYLSDPGIELGSPAFQGTLKSLLQHLRSKTSILQCSAFFMVQLSYLYMTTGETIALTIWAFVGKVMSLLSNMLSRFVMVFLQRGKRLLISWLQSPSQ